MARDVTASPTRRRSARGTRDTPGAMCIIRATRGGRATGPIMLSTLAARHLLRDIIDYAGLFPPAALPLPAAVDEFIRQRLDPAARELVARFICPSRKLTELLAIDAFRHDSRQHPWRLSVLGTAARSASELFANVADDFKRMSEFTTACGSARPDAYETRLPDDLASGSVAPDILAEVPHLTFRQNPVAPPAMFFELPLLDDWRRNASALIRAIADLNAATPDSPRHPIGVKLRTGGVEPAAFPDAERVACVAARCAECGVPLKATAGLHHPIRHFNAALAARMHGFLNLFGGLALLSAGAGGDKSRSAFGEADMCRILDDEDPRSFRFTDEAFAWREFTISAAEIAAARQHLATSFGSCSIQEPLDDLRALHLIAPPGESPRATSAAARLSHPHG